MRRKRISEPRNWLSYTKNPKENVDTFGKCLHFPRDPLKPLVFPLKTNGFRTNYTKILSSTASLERLSKTWSCFEREEHCSAQGGIGEISPSLTLKESDRPRRDRMLSSGPPSDPRSWLGMGKYCSP